jgi:Zinc carboxypeptidase/Carboxypeptidase activation peptide
MPTCNPFLKKIMLLTLLLTAVQLAHGKSYQGNQVLRIYYDNDNSPYINQVLQGMDIWRRKGRQIDVHVPAIMLETTKAMLRPFEYSVLIPNVQELIDEENTPARSRKMMADSSSYRRKGSFEPASSAPEIFKNYQDASVYVNFLSSLPGVTSKVLNHTHNGNPITAFKFGIGRRNIVYVGGIHAREWVSPSSATYLTWFLSGNSTEAVRLRDQFTFTMIPVVNMDGFEYTRNPNGDRMWRKNRQPNKGSSCIGVDPNR